MTSLTEIIKQSIETGIKYSKVVPMLKNQPISKVIFASSAAAIIGFAVVSTLFHGEEPSEPKLPDDKKPEEPCKQSIKNRKQRRARKPRLENRHFLTEEENALSDTSTTNTTNEKTQGSKRRFVSDYEGDLRFSRKAGVSRKDRESPDSDDLYFMIIEKLNS